MKKYLIASSIALLALASIVSAQEYPYSKDLTVGMSGPEVSALQTWLISNGYDIPAISRHIVSGGFFGEQTRMALSAYQRAIGLPYFGYFGRLTRQHINSGQSSVHVPIITSVNGPSNLNVNQTGTWTIQATNAANETGSLGYSVTWGDESIAGQFTNAVVPAQNLTFAQNTTFTHTYYSAGTYTVKFVVRNERGFTATKNMTVNVGNVSQPSITVTAPNGGETWVRGISQNITWRGSVAALPSAGTIWLQPSVPACAEDNAPVRCMIAVKEPYQIAQNVNLNSGFYSWPVGSYVPEVMTAIYPPVYPNVPDGQYKIKVCNTNPSICDTSDAYFNITTNTTGNRPPVISGIDAPTTLSVNQSGTWTVRATDPLNGTLSFRVDWGDTTICPAGYACSTEAPAGVNASGQTTSTFTHSYTSSGTYVVRFTVTNTAGLVAQSSATVQVTNTSTAGLLRIVSPNGGEVWPANSIHQIAWSMAGTNFQGTYDVNQKVDLYLDRPNFYCITTPCPTMYVLDKNIPVNTQYNWIVGTDVNNATIPVGDYKVRVCLAGSTTNCDSSDGTFTITGQQITNTGWGCMTLTQGATYNPVNPPTVCGYLPVCPFGQNLIASDGGATWPDGSRKGLFSCSTQLPM